MVIQPIRAFNHASPFRPYEIRMASGERYRVPHPDFLSVSPKGTALSLWDEDGSIGAYLETALVEVRMNARGSRRSKRRRS